MQSLTRRVLTEKAVMFARYDNPSNVPNYIWEKIFKTLQNKTCHNEIYECVAKEILSPMLKISYWNIHPIMPINHIQFCVEKNHDITFNFGDTPLKTDFFDFSHFKDFKYVICRTWNNRITSKFNCYNGISTFKYVT